MSNKVLNSQVVRPGFCGFRWQCKGDERKQRDSMVLW